MYVSSLTRLKSGKWPSDTILSAWKTLHSQWPHDRWIVRVQEGVNSLPAVLLNLPLWVPLLFVGGCIFTIGFIALSLIEESIYKPTTAK